MHLSKTGASTFERRIFSYRLIGDASKAKEKLGWQPKYTLQEMVKEMVAYDLELFRKHKTLLEAGFHVLSQHE